jgi:outer membrane protein assembly factor BamE (lipoprotein component of BamABCDE complex)
LRRNLVKKGDAMQEKVSWNGGWSVLLMLVSLLLLNLAGCSVYMAAKQPSQKNLDVMAVGTPRSLVLAELGSPAATETRDGKKVDVFSFVQGYSQGSKTTRAVFHGLADVFTAGLWEVVGTPTESIFHGTKVSYEVTYDDGSRVEKVVALTEKSREEAPKEIAAESMPKPAEPSPELVEAVSKVEKPSSKPPVEAEK